MTAVVGVDRALRESSAARESRRTRDLRLSARAGDRHDGLAVRIVEVGLVLDILLQRISLPGGVPVTLVVTLATAALLALLRAVVPSRGVLPLFLGATAVMALFAWTAARGQPAASMTSLLFLLLVYAPWVLRLRGALAPRLPEVGRFFVRVMGVFGLVGIAQLVAQFVHAWSFVDYIGRLPASLLVPGYNPEAIMSYGSGIYRAQAFVFLEPSMLSQYSGLAVVIGLALRLRTWELAGPVLGLIAALSGTGLILLGAGLAILLLTRPFLLRPSFVVIAALGLVGVLVSPAAGPLLGRSTEIGQTGSSGSLRFIDPYAEVLDGLRDDPGRLFVGAGPGTSERLLASDRGTGTGQAVVYTIPAKLVFEYGALAGAAFLVVILACLLHPGPIPLLGPAMTVMLFFLSGALLQPNTALLAWLLVVLWRRPLREPGTRAVAPRPVDRVVPARRPGEHLEVGVPWRRRSRRAQPPPAPRPGRRW